MGTVGKRGRKQRLCTPNCSLGTKLCLYSREQFYCGQVLRSPGSNVSQVAWTNTVQEAFKQCHQKRHSKESASTIS